MEVYFDNLSDESGRLDKLAADVESLLEGAEELVQATGGELPEKERQRLDELLARVKSSSARIKLQALNGCKAADRVIRKHPYHSAGIALVVGLLVGVLASRPGRDED